MYERLLDDATKTYWTNGPEEAERLRPLREHLFHQFREVPVEALPILLNALQEPDIFRPSTAVEIIGELGYPANETAILALISVVEAHDPNSPAWQTAATVLHGLGPAIVLPYLIRRFLELGDSVQHRFNTESSISLSVHIEGLSWMLTRTTFVEREWAIRCCPVINYVLTILDKNNALQDTILYSLLDIVEEAGTSVAYTIPILLDLVRKHKENDIGRRARNIVYTYPPEVLENYTFLLPDQHSNSETETH